MLDTVADVGALVVPGAGITAHAASVNGRVAQVLGAMAHVVSGRAMLGSALGIRIQQSLITSEHPSWFCWFLPPPPPPCDVVLEYSLWISGAFSIVRVCVASVLLRV